MNFSEIKIIFILIIVFAVFGCMHEGARPFTYSVGIITIDGNDYSSALIIKNADEGIYVVGGFVSDAPLGALTIGLDNTQRTPLQIVPSKGEIIYKDEIIVIEDNAVLLWFIRGNVIRQELEGFSLEKELVLPDQLKAGKRVANERS